MEGGWRVLRARPALAAAGPHGPGGARRPTTRSPSGSSSASSRSCPRDREPDVVGHLGPDLLGPDWDADEAVRRLREQPDRPIKEALLDQTRLAGIGNMYAAELCFVAGVAPRPRSPRCPTCARLVDRAHQMLDAQPPSRPAAHHRRPGARPAVLGLRPRRPSRAGAAARRSVETMLGDAGAGADDVRLPELPALADGRPPGPSSRPPGPDLSSDDRTGEATAARTRRRSSRGSQAAFRRIYGLRRIRRVDTF